jgi:hypothetical protein
MPCLAIYTLFFCAAVLCCSVFCWWVVGKVCGEAKSAAVARRTNPGTRHVVGLSSDLSGLDPSVHVLQLLLTLDSLL